MLSDCGKELLKPWISVQNVVLIGSVIFMIALFKPNSSELASWVQAVGSIAAIWGALYVSRSEQNNREKAELKEKQERVEQIREMFKKVARSQSNHLNHLCGVLIEARSSGSDLQIKEYFSLGLNLHWDPNLDSLGQFSITDLASAKIDMINELKVGAQFAKMTCEKLLNVPHDDSLTPVIEQMRHHEMMAITALEIAKKQEKKKR